MYIDQLPSLSVPTPGMVFPVSVNGADYKLVFSSLIRSKSLTVDTINAGAIGSQTITWDDTLSAVPSAAFVGPVNGSNTSGTNATIRNVTSSGCDVVWRNDLTSAATSVTIIIYYIP